MKKLLVFAVISGVIHFTTFGHGVAIKNAVTGQYLKLLSSSQAVTVYDQVSTTKTTQVFKNQLETPCVIKYAFPLHDAASATSLRWKVNNVWQTAIFAPAPQDTTLPGGGTPDEDLMTYLGDNPMFFDVPDTIRSDSTLTVELTYVELLPYSFATVQYDYPNDYMLIQTQPLNLQSFHFVLESQRNIDSIHFPGFNGASITNTGLHAEVTWQQTATAAIQNYTVTYSLAASTMGLYGYSTYLPDSMMVCDSLGNGYFTFIVEPSPDTTQVIPKVFSLVIDRSGSMTGSKMAQAQDAARFIVNHLNIGDYFNLIAFNHEVTKFMPDHVPFNAATKQAALNFINSLTATGMTDIELAMQYTIQDFAGNDTTVANIVIFMTDGQPTSGITFTPAILDSIQSNLNFYNVQYLMINTFGIGLDVNQQLLSLMASQNNGLCTFLLDQDLLEVISQFYLMVCNPVLLNINMTFTPPVVIEPYPVPLPNLYIGQQLILAGRYDSVPEGPLHISFTGQAFGQIHTYNYEFPLTNAYDTNYLFTTKIWAKKKIDYLYIQYFTYPAGSPQADSIKNVIIGISTCYNVSSPFTHFGWTPPPVGMEEQNELTITTDQLSAYPNPFMDEITFLVNIESYSPEPLIINIYDPRGSLIRSLRVEIPQPGINRIHWDGKDTNGRTVPDGLYWWQVPGSGKPSTGKILKVSRL